MRYPVVTLHPGREQSLLRRHQWIFSKAIRQKDKSIRNGDIISVGDAAGNILATGHFQDSSLAIRILEFAEVTIDPEFWKRKLQAAVEYRQCLGLIADPATNGFRLVHGEGDELPGLIIDVYDQIAVLQAHSIGMHRMRMEIAQSLLHLDELHLTGVYDRSSDALHLDGSADESGKWLAGRGETQTQISENGLLFEVDIAHGQKTGFFLDQRTNRHMIRAFAHGKHVLNCFCYTGGFTVYALAGGATHVTSIDTSANALELLDRNIEANALTGRHRAVTADVMHYLTHDREMYDLVICDPPAFAKSMHKRHNAVQAYKRLNALAMQRVRPGGMLFTYSCSQVVDKKLFHDTLVAAAIEVTRPVRVMFEMSQGPDHPVSVFHPEGSYLKGLALYVS